MTIPTPPPIPDRVVLGANGAYWRAFDTEPALEGLYSMCPNSTDNDPVVPVMTFLPVTETGAALVAALQKHKDRIQALQELVCTCDSKHIFQAVLHDETCPVWMAAQEPPHCTCQSSWPSDLRCPACEAAAQEPPAECPDCGLDLEPGEKHGQVEGIGCVAQDPPAEKLADTMRSGTHSGYWPAQEPPAKGDDRDE